MFPETAEGAFEVGEAVDGEGLVVGASPGAADEGRDRGGDARNGANTARYFLNVYAGVRGCDRH